MKVLNKNKCLKLPFTPVTAANNAIKLPLLISVPHGGYDIPLELEPYVSLNHLDIFPDSDPYTRSIYALKNDVLYYHDTNTARAIIDLNRSEDDLPPNNKDGVIKSHTIFGKQIYREGYQPDSSAINKLLQRYYYPYHNRLITDLEDPYLLCGLDCHSMLEHPPGDGNSCDKTRPFICLSNNGDEYGEGIADELTCPTYLIDLLANCLRREFPEEADNIVLNTPFKGGHISLAHSNETPWIQIELNRRAYLRRPWFNPSTMSVTKERLGELRNKFLQSFTAFCFEAGNMQYPQNYADLISHNKSDDPPFTYNYNS